MPTPEMSDITTHGIRVGATAAYLPGESSPEDGNYVFGYRIVIVNDGDAPATLLSRHWIIIDADGNREEVRGPGVVGQTPRLEPTKGFKYSSFCPLPTPWGTMEGFYKMQRDNGEVFEARIGRFYLRVNTPAPQTAVD